MKKILSIDGGGIRGVFPAAFLAEMEDVCGIQGKLWEYFDLIAGTSTGGIIALALGLGIPAAEICELYEKKGPEIFAQPSGSSLNYLKSAYRSVRRFFSLKYSNKSLEENLKSIFKEKKLGEAKTRLLIPSWNARHEPQIFKTAHKPRFKMDYKQQVVDVALATSAAPTYFPNWVTQKGLRLIDGGVFANNPTAFAAVEGIGELGWDKKDLRILSLGTLNEATELTNKTGGKDYLLKAADIFMAGQNASSLGLTKILTGDVDQREDILFRIDPKVPAGKYSLDGVKEIRDLKNHGLAEARNNVSRLQGVFFMDKAEVFKPSNVLDEGDISK